MVCQDDISMYEVLVVVTSIARLHGVVMSQKLSCVHDYSQSKTVFVLGSSYWDTWCVRMVSRTYQVSVVVTSISWLQWVIMYGGDICFS